MYNGYCIANHRFTMYIKHGSQESIVISNERGMSNTEGRMWKMRYIYNIFNPRIHTQKKKTNTKYQHSTKGPKGRESKKNQKKKR